MKKRGQITYFIIIGIVIVAILAVTIFYTSKIDVKKSTLSEVDEVRVLIQDCLGEEIIKAKDNKLLKEGMNSGTIDEGNDLWKRRMEERINLNMIRCLNGNIFPGLDIKFDQVRTTLSIIGYQVNNYFVLEAIHADAEIPITIKKGNDIYKIRKFYAVYEAR